MRKTCHLLCMVLHLALAAQSKWNADLQSLLDDKELSMAHIGLSVVDIETTLPLYQQEGRKMYSTASCLKLLTTACALETLGEHHQFSTQIYTDGQVHNGVLQGNIIIQGSGDPTFASSRYGLSLGTHLDDIIKVFKKLGITKIKGHLGFDISRFDVNPVSPKTYWLDVGNYFGGAIWPINVDENIYRVTFSRTTRQGDSTKVLKIEPDIGIHLDNHVTIGGKTDEAYIYCAPYATYGYIKGTLPPSAEPYTIKGAMPQPLDYFGKELHKKLKSQHITVQEGIKYYKNAPAKKQLLWESKSPKLAEIIKQTNWFSINLYAEALLRAVGMKKYGSFLGENGTKALSAFIRAQNLDTAQISTCDGSGVSPASMCSPELMSTFLAGIKTKPWFSSFYNSLSSSGGNGTLSSMGRGSLLEGNLRAKSGNMDGICAYAGYLKTRSGKMLSFTLFINNFKADNASIKRKVERILVKIAEL